MRKIRVWFAVIASAAVIVMTLTSGLHNYLIMAKQQPRITYRVHQRGVALQKKSFVRDAFISAPDGVSDVAYPTIDAFCRALRLKGQAWNSVVDPDVADKDAAIDRGLGAQYVRAGDLVLVFSETSTTCHGELRRFAVRISLIRDVPSGTSGWVLTRRLSND
jgi:hypothetical protein